ncbi:MAG: DUF3160 domain-containing protein [Bacteroidales bacterium]|nr:DUF3160 domain-containing protein [Bacteroidales bacterium]
MKNKLLLLVSLIAVSILTVHPQSNFSLEAYSTFLESNKNLTTPGLTSLYPLQQSYYSEIERTNGISDIYYLDSVLLKYELTTDEIELLEKNHFMVSERLNIISFGEAYADIFHKDLPVFLSTDAILHALHRSYDQILIDIEKSVMEPNLIEITDAMYDAYYQLYNKYAAITDTLFYKALLDVDVYVTVAKSLIHDTTITPNVASSVTVSDILDAIQAENYTVMPLFTDRLRSIDYSQFKVRGHYEDILEEYFKTMMWYGRIDFLLTSPPADIYPESDIKRMSYGTVLLNELRNIADVKDLLATNEKIITYMVGESDNLTPLELDSLLAELSVEDADELLDSAVYSNFKAEITANDMFSQKILSSVIMMDPFSAEPDKLPVSYRLMGQRFIIDSYIFSNVVYDRIIYNDMKIWRPMPDPLDAMFVLGNNDPLPLLKEELDSFHYNSQLASLRYLVDKYDDGFWENSLYNIWLNSIRTLSPSDDNTSLPLFMKTSAWRMEKLNTQLASWTQLRHDNLLYAKQSYTGGIICSYPHSYIEPYPSFYRQIGNFAGNAHSFFSDLETGDYNLSNIIGYFDNLTTHMEFLAQVAEKEIQNTLFTATEIEKLHKMLIVNTESGCGAPPYLGWFFDLFYGKYEQGMEPDFVVADVHTQPTDEFGNTVGNVLHVGVGNVNMGVFLIPSPSHSFKYTAFVGPVMSYYEKITSEFNRLTDSEWKEMVNGNSLPERPKWTNVYIADSAGGKKDTSGCSLPYTSKFTYTDVHNALSENQMLTFPNPVKSSLNIEFIGEQIKEVLILSVEGKTLLRKYETKNEAIIDLSGIPQGIYVLKVKTSKGDYTTKIIKEEKN